MLHAQVMQDWLNIRRLDRKALGVLAANLAAYEAYHEHVRDEVAATLNGMLAILDPEGAVRAANPPPPAAPAEVKLEARGPVPMDTSPGPMADPRQQGTAALLQVASPQRTEPHRFAPLGSEHTAPAMPGGANNNSIVAHALATNWPGDIASLKAVNAARRPRSPWDVPEDEAPDDMNNGSRCIAVDRL